MKKLTKTMAPIFCVTLLALSLAACKAGKDAAENTPSAEADDLPPNLTYSEEYTLEGDSGDYANAAEAAKLVFDYCKENEHIPAYSDETLYTMVLVDLADIEDEECYVYRLDIDEPTGTLGAAYAYAYQSGNIYMQGYGGQWVPLLQH